MRHDVDFDILFAKALAYIENKIRVRSTFYFRWPTADPATIEYVKKLGHDVGLHYETLATFCKKNDIYDAAEIDSNIIKECRNLLKTEIKTFESQFGDIYSVASHGDERNRLLGVANTILLKGQDISNFYINISASLLEREPRTEQIFVADSGNKWDPYSMSQALDENWRRIYCLIHPVWWRERQ